MSRFGYLFSIRANARKCTYNSDFPTLKTGYECRLAAQNSFFIIAAVDDSLNFYCQKVRRLATPKYNLNVNRKCERDVGRRLKKRRNNCVGAGISLLNVAAWRCESFSFEWLSCIKLDQRNARPLILFDLGSL